ncbi:dethiobiotin synthase [Pelobium manganitolerans]|uniref:dethiobiotin synthase n=1 Tax=Pelobium manganitolerans TaxID=1842495 RepID=UPI003FA362BD
MSQQYFVTGIGTEIGKTLCAAVLTEHLQADYWKPIQSGDLHHTDSMKVAEFISNTKTQIFQEAYRLQQPFSPHHSANLDGVHIELAKIQLPQTQNNLIVEGAGGLMVPLNGKDLIIDLIKKLGLEVILVSKNYLGSINHTLLSIEALRNRGIPIKGIIFNGDRNESTESIILSRTQIHLIANIPTVQKANTATVKHLAQSLKFNL